jgi:hypothetical protein
VIPEKHGKSWAEVNFFHALQYRAPCPKNDMSIGAVGSSKRRMPLAEIEQEFEVRLRK